MSDTKYCYPPDYSVLKNKLDLRDSTQLERAERRLVIQRVLDGIPSGDFDLAHLKAIHRHLFQDVFDWAGEIRTTEISKGGSQFQFRTPAKTPNKAPSGTNTITPPTPPCPNPIISPIKAPIAAATFANISIGGSFVSSVRSSKSNQSNSSEKVYFIDTKFLNPSINQTWNSSLLDNLLL